MLTMSNIVLVGCTHIDFKGVERLSRALEQIKPEVITIEATKEHLDPSTPPWVCADPTKLEVLVNNGFPEETAKVLLEMHGTYGFYELSGPINYANSHRIPVHVIDHPDAYEFGRKFNEREFERFAKSPRDDLSLYTVENWQRWIDEGYADDERAFSGEESERLTDLEDEVREFMVLRDVTMANRIRELSRGRNLLHIGGSKHLYEWGTGTSLYDELKDLDPERNTLIVYEE